MMPEQTTLSHALALAVISTTGVFIGLSFLGAVSRFKRLLRSTTKTERWRNAGYVLARVGVTIIPGLIAYLILPYLYIEPTWQAWVYVVGLIVPFLGYLILAFTGEDEGSTP